MSILSQWGLGVNASSRLTLARLRESRRARRRYRAALRRLEAKAAAERAGSVARAIPFGDLLRDSAAGRARIADTLARLEERNA